MTLDAAGDLAFADYGNNRVRKIDLTGKISTIAGNGTAGYCGDGGPAVSACLNDKLFDAFFTTKSGGMGIG